MIANAMPPVRGLEIPPFDRGQALNGPLSYEPHGLSSSWLLLIGAAKRLTTGHATGIDIWNAEDLSGNAPDALKANIALEGVGAKTTVRSEDARQMRFGEDSFDVMVSNLCLHNIYKQPGRTKALHEIVRVLKTGGLAVISDYKAHGRIRGGIDRVRAESGDVSDGLGGDVPSASDIVARKAEDLGA